MAYFEAQEAGIREMVRGSVADLMREILGDATDAELETLAGIAAAMDTQEKAK